MSYPNEQAGGSVDHLLGELEAAIMRRIWIRGHATVREVLDDLSADHRVLAYTTVMTVMSRLDGKGLLTRELLGKTYIYRPALSEQELLRQIAGQQVRHVIAAFGDVAITQFLSEIDRLSPERRQLLERLASEETSQ
jgi:predicted transcriptional regulator